MGATLVQPVLPEDEDVTTADVAVEQVTTYLTRLPGKQRQVRLLLELAAGGSQVLVVPLLALELLALILAYMAAGQGVSVVPAHAELTTQQAANLLNVSRPYLIGLLEAGEIEYRKVGKHRRVKASSLLDYMRADDRRRRTAADELSALTQEMGLT